MLIYLTQVELFQKKLVNAPIKKNKKKHLKSVKPQINNMSRQVTESLSKKKYGTEICGMMFNLATIRSEDPKKYKYT